MPDKPISLFIEVLIRGCHEQGEQIRAIRLLYRASISMQDIANRCSLHFCMHVTIESFPATYLTFGGITNAYVMYVRSDIMGSGIPGRGNLHVSANCIRKHPMRIGGKLHEAETSCTQPF